MRRFRSPRIATVCVLGHTVKRLSGNAARIRLMQKVVEKISTRESWQRLDAVVFPGGYFRLAESIGDRSDWQRILTIQSQPFGNATIEAASQLDSISAGCFLIVGADSPAHSRSEWGDQFCIAINTKGVIGLARKIFPTDGDTVDRDFSYVTYAKDYSSTRRIILLPNGSRAILCACYDIFAFGPQPHGMPRSVSAIRDVRMGKHKWQIGEDEFPKIRDSAVERWLEFLADRNIDVAISSIHGFKQPGRDGYWQRHGIAAASASIDGLAIAASHFNQALPSVFRSPLASLNVPRTALALGAARTSHAHNPIDGFEIADGATRALVRLFGAR